MSIVPRRNRIAFRPNFGDITLEERVVLNGASATNATMAAQVASFQAGGGSENAQARLGDLTPRQLRQASRQGLQAARTSLQQFANRQLAALNNDPANLGVNGRLTPEALADFKANMAGAINATTLRLSAQASLMPGAGRRLLPRLQNALLGNQNNSLMSRVSNLIDSGRANRSQAFLQNAINRQINSSFTNNAARLTNFFNATPMNRLSVDPTTGQRIPLAQFVGNRAISQINNSFGALANSVGPNAEAVLFDSNGVFNPQAVAGFQRQFSNALGTAAFQVGNILSMFPNAMTTLAPQIQSTLFETGIDPLTGLSQPSLINGLTGVFPTGTGQGAVNTPFSLAAFNTGFQGAFTTPFQNFSNPINNFFGIQLAPGTGGNPQLPNGFFQGTSSFPGLFGSQFTNSNFNSGFNNGFFNSGSGFPGFGTAPTGFNTGFGTGFDSFVDTMNQQFGFTQPTFTTTTISAVG